MAAVVVFVGGQLLALAEGDVAVQRVQGLALVEWAPMRRRSGASAR